MLIVTTSTKRGRTKFNQIIADEINASIKSRSAYILLVDKLIPQDEDYIESTRSLWVWLNAREKFLVRRKKKNEGNLTCDYCGKEHLDIGGKKPKDLIKNNKNKNLATVDHIQPLVGEGEKFNEKNMCVACKKCNKNKGEKSLENFLICLPIKKIEKTALFLINLASNRVELKIKIEKTCEKILV